VQHLEGLLEKVMERLDSKEQAADPGSVLRTRELFEGMRREQESISKKMAEADGFMADAKKRMNADGFRVGKSTIRIGGFLKYDASVTRYSAGDTPPGAFIDDFYLPQQIPVALRGAKRPEGFDFNNNVRESRLFVAGETDVGKDKLSGRLEIDFQSVNTNADERATNGFSPEIRHAWIQWNNVLAGQNWSLLQNTTVLPDSLEFIGPVEGMVFVRQPQLRVTFKNFAFSLEQPETVVTARGSGAQTLSNDGALPDVVARFLHKGKFGEISVGGIVRQLSCDSCITGISDNAVGYGASIAGLLKVGKQDDIRFMVNAGSGIGRYIGVNIVNDAAVRANGQLDPITVYSGMVAYRHVISKTWRANLYGAYFKADNPVLDTGGTPTDRIYSVHGNLIWSPTPAILFGVESKYAERRTENGADGNMFRVQFSSKYFF
jgi:hypothetical protein